MVRGTKGYSYRSATMGSTLAARRAGMAQASTATSTRTSVTHTKCVPVVGLTPYRKPARTAALALREWDGNDVGIMRHRDQPAGTFLHQYASHYCVSRLRTIPSRKTFSPFQLRPDVG